jgi:hypothetical protein
LAGGEHRQLCPHGRTEKQRCMLEMLHNRDPEIVCVCLSIGAYLNVRHCN